MPKKTTPQQDTPTHDHILYRKYRPEVFADVVGQDRIVETLTGAVKTKKPHHAYLFTGTRGTGKTTLARIFAKELGVDGVDLYEIDAASHNSVDDIRELRDGVRTLPITSPFKVYILDEVHMLSKSAFNALLKTLEEPPAHVIFMLATTELDKVPETIVSRCQVLKLTSPDEHTLRDFVISIGGKEGFTIDTDAAELIALLGDKSFRDTHGIMQRVFEYADTKHITAGFVETITGTPSYTISQEYIRGFLSGDLEVILTHLEQMTKSAQTLTLFFRRTIQLFRIVLILRVQPNFTSGSISEVERTFAKEMITQYGPKITSAYLLKLLSWYDKHKIIPSETLALEMALLEAKGE